MTKRLRTHYMENNWLRRASWWGNYFEYINPRAPFVKGDTVASAKLFRTCLSEDLAGYNATIVELEPSGCTGWLFEFETEEDATAFVLKWS